MKGKDIFEGLQYVGDDLIEEAENGHFSRGKKLVQRPILLAALIALMLALVGCGVVYVLNMQNLKLGDKQATEEWWDEEQKTMVSETVSRQVLTFSGLKGTPNYEAAKEWYEFRQSYDPDWKIYHEYKDAGKLDRGTEEYSLYNIYTPEMKAKVDEITKKYGLKLKGAPVEAVNGRALLNYLNMDGILLPEAKASGNDFNVFYHDGGWFHTYMDMELAESPDWPYQFLFSLYYSPKDCFDNAVCELNEASDWQEWNYTTVSGAEVLVIRSENSPFSWAFCDRGDATITLRIETIREVYSDDETIRFAMTDDQLRQVLDCIDFSIRPQPGDPALLEGKTASKALTQTQNGYTVTVKDVFTDGTETMIYLGLTAPEDTDLEQYFEKMGGSTPHIAGVSFSSVEDSALHSSMSHGSQQDGDGKANTMDYVIQMSRSVKEGVGFPKGSTWKLYLENLVQQEWNRETFQYDIQWEIPGVWSFEITLDQGDWREMEFVGQPITTPACIGWDMDGNDVFEEVTVTSLSLRALGGGYISEWDKGSLEFADYKNGKFPTVVLKDGRTIRLDGGFGIYDSEADGDRIPLDEVEALILMDGTRLTPVI